jgi:two-component system, cell cycle sensor histidine kinase and response regulator CckA
LKSHDVAELAQTLFEEIGDAAFVVDPPTLRLVNVNPMAQRLTGLQRAELMTIRLGELLRSDGDEGLASLKRALHSTQTFHSREGYSLRRERDGAWIPVNLTLTRLHTEQGPLGLVLARDISDRIQAEEELRLANALLERRVQERTAELARVNEALQSQVAERDRAVEALRDSEERFRSAFEHTGVATVLTDIGNRFTLVNAAFAGLFGYPSAEMLGMGMADVTHPDDLVASYAGREQLLAGEKQFFQMEKRYIHRDGHFFWGVTNVSLVRDPAGQPLLYVGQVQDITDRKRAELRLTTQHAVISILAQAPDLRDAAPQILRAVGETMGWDMGGLWVVDRRANVLTCVNVWHAGSEGVAEFGDLSRRTAFAPGVGLPGRVWAAGEPVWIVDITEEPHFPRAAAAGGRLRGGLGFPIRFGGEILGVAEFFSRENHRPDDELLRMLKSLGSQIGQFIERKRAEERLRLFRALIDRTSDIVEVIEVETGRFLDANQQACSAHGYTREEYLLLSVSDVDPLVAARPWGETLAQRRQTGDLPFESQHRRKDGSTFPVEVNLNFVRLDREYLVAVVRDITDRKRSEEAVRQAQQRLESVVASSPAILFTLAIADDRIEGINWISENIKEILGYAPADAYSREWWSGNTHPEDRDEATAITRDELFALGRTTHECRFRHADGTYRWTRVEIRLIQNPSGPVQAVGSWSDVTERKHLEEQFRQSQKMEAVGRLAGGVAHDFNNLLTIINGYGELVLESLPAQSLVYELIREVVDAGERAAGLTRQLLAFSRKAIVEPRVLDLSALVVEVERMLTRVVGEDVQLAVATDPEVGAVKADPGQIQQVILNLVVNARDAMPTGGQLTIGLQSVELDESYVGTHPDARPGPHVLLSVSDTGCGMDAATVARAFEPFFTTKGEYGTGLGLATVHGIVRQAGGHVAVSSEVGRGTTFKVYLPRIERESAAPRPRRASPRLARGGETILLVEDEDGVRALSRHVLRGCGYTVLEAREGAEAVRLAEQHRGRINLLVTDVVMPRMDGREVSEQVAAINPGIKVLFLSGYTDDAVVRHGILQAEVAFLQKPFTPASLTAKVRAVLDS